MRSRRYYSAGQSLGWAGGQLTLSGVDQTSGVDQSGY